MLDLKVMNTKLEYMYRDAENYKTYEDCILEGELSIKDLAPYLFLGDFFVPSEVGLKDLQEQPLHVYDHIWHEIIDVDSVEQIPTVPISAKCFIKMFQEASKNDWNQNVVVERLGMI